MLDFIVSHLWQWWQWWDQLQGVLKPWQTLNKAVLEPRVSPAFAITYFCNHCNIRFENTSKYVDTLTLFSKNLNQRSLTPRWPLTPYLLRSHVWPYPRIIVSKSHDNTSMYVDRVINFAKYHIHTTYRMSDHIVSYWTQFRRDTYWTQFRRDKNCRYCSSSFIVCLCVYMNKNTYMYTLDFKYCLTTDIGGRCGTKVPWSPDRH